MHYRVFGTLSYKTIYSFWIPMRTRYENPFILKSGGQLVTYELVTLVLEWCADKLLSKHQSINTSQLRCYVECQDKTCSDLNVSEILFINRPRLLSSCIIYFCWLKFVVLLSETFTRQSLQLIHFLQNVDKCFSKQLLTHKTKWPKTDAKFKRKIMLGCGLVGLLCQANEGLLTKWTALPLPMFGQSK